MPIAVGRARSIRLHRRRPRATAVSTPVKPIGHRPLPAARPAAVMPECIETRWYAIRYADCTICVSSCLENPIDAYFNRNFSYSRLLKIGISAAGLTTLYFAL